MDQKNNVIKNKLSKQEKKLKELSEYPLIANEKGELVKQSNIKTINNKEDLIKHWHENE